MVVKRYCLLIALCFLPTSLFSNKLYFPKVSFGGGSTTTIILMNSGMTTVSSPFQIYAQTGDLLRSIPTTVPGGGSTRLSIADPGQSIINSWGVFDAGKETVKGVATVDMRSTTGTLINRAGVFGVEAANHFSIPVDVAEKGLSNTVFAMANVNRYKRSCLSTFSSCRKVASALHLRRERQNLQGLLCFLRGIRSPTFVTDIWPELKAGFKGTLLIAVVSGQASSLVVTALSLKDGLFSPVPAISPFVNIARVAGTIEGFNRIRKYSDRMHSGRVRLSNDVLRKLGIYAAGLKLGRRDSNPISRSSVPFNNTFMRIDAQRYRQWI